jgi:hypothetical protein
VSGRLGVLFENSIVCLVVFVCCLFLPHLAVPVVGCGFFVTFGDFDQVSLNGFCLESLILAQDERWRRA